MNNAIHERNSTDFHGLEVLIVDSDVEERERIRDMLLISPGVNVRAMDLSESFLEVIAKKKYDLIIMEMHEKEGTLNRYLREIRQMKNEQDIILIGKDDSYDHLLLTIREGALDYFQKPLREEDLSRIIQLHKYRILKKRFSDRIDQFIIHKKVQLEFPTDISIISYASSRIADEIYHSGSIPPGELYNLNLALFEAMTNALEHGNLGISYSDKSNIIEEGDYLESITNLCNTEPYCNRKIYVTYEIDEKQIRIDIEDEGEGFDSSALMKKLNDEVNEDFHGRGLILISRIVDDVMFNESGNCLSLIIRRS